jgi:hypothetical protein
MKTFKLEQIQELLHRLITAPSGVADALSHDATAKEQLEKVVAGDERLSSTERVDVYANMYFYRILDALKEDFPATVAVIGPENFHNLITDFLIAFPPTEPSIFFAGRNLAEFCQTHRLRKTWPFLADLVVVERALIEVFHAPDSPPLTAASLRELDPERWSALELRTIGAMQLVACGFNVVPLIRAVAEAMAWSPPAAVSTPILVWRKRNKVFYRELNSPEDQALELLRSGIKFAELCEQVATSDESEDSSQLIFEMLQRWVDDELLRRPESL